MEPLSLSKDSSGSMASMSLSETSGESATLFSPDTTEFVSLERQLREEFAHAHDDVIAHDVTNNNEGDVSGRVVFRRVEIGSDESILEEVDEEVEADPDDLKREFRSELESKLQERKRSIDQGEDLQLMAQRGLRQFTRADEYLYAMKEDLAEWFNMLYADLDMDADNFMEKLETGENLIMVGTKKCFLCFVLYRQTGKLGWDPEIRLLSRV